MAFSVFSHNGKLLPIDQATIPLSSVEYAYGFGVYETIRSIRGKPMFLQDHMKRLEHSARMIELEHPFTATEVTAWVQELVTEVGPDAVCNLKVLLIGGKDRTGAQLFIIPLAPRFPEKKLYTQGASAITFPYERLIPQAKTLNMFGSFIGYRKARREGCYDALLVNREECVTEGTGTNFFGIRGKVLFSPPVDEILEGVTRKHVLEVAKKNGFEVVEDDIAVTDLNEFEGAFLTSTSTKIMPLKKIDGWEFPEIIEPLKELMRAFDEFYHSSEPS